MSGTSSGKPLEISPLSVDVAPQASHPAQIVDHALPSPPRHGFQALRPVTVGNPKSLAAVPLPQLLSQVPASDAADILRLQTPSPVVPLRGERVFYEQVLAVRRRTGWTTAFRVRSDDDTPSPRRAGRGFPRIALHC